MTLQTFRNDLKIDMKTSLDAITKELGEIKKIHKRPNAEDETGAIRTERTGTNESITTPQMGDFPYNGKKKTKARQLIRERKF